MEMANGCCVAIKGRTTIRATVGRGCDKCWERVEALVTEQRLGYQFGLDVLSQPLTVTLDSSLLLGKQIHWVYVGRIT